MEEYISISCKTTTYGRISYLEEMLESFLRLKYKGKKEMLIVNDYEKQTLIFDHPEVRIINRKETFKTIGEKENFAVDNCKYNTVAVMDDDDICMPNHLQNINKYFHGNELLHWQNGIAMVSHKIAAIRSLGNAGIVYTKDIWKKVGGFPKHNGGNDTRFINKILASGAKVQKAFPPNDEVSFVYTWGGGSYHQSGLGDDEGRPEEEQVVERHKRHIEGERKAGNIPTGIIELKPHWNRDYEQMLKDYLNDS